MKNPYPFLVLLAALANPVLAVDCQPLLNYEAKLLRGGPAVNLCEAYRGKVILAVNTASQCGYTPQFEGLEALYQKYKDRGFVVLGFPSNDFRQEYSEAEQTAKVCYLDYGVTFPMFSKSAVKGADANPFFKQLAEQSGQAPQWNFYKYLVDAGGKVVATYSSRTAPDDEELRQKIEAVLEKVAGKK